MKIGVISDTHIPFNSDKLPPEVVEHFKECDLIVHAGDIVEADVLKVLENLAETKAVFGNMDGLELREKLPQKIVFECAGKTIGVVHGTGPGAKVHQIVEGMFNEKLDIIIFGHSHMPLVEKRGKTLLVNPGSPTDTIFAPYRSFGIIEIKGDKVDAEIIRIED